MNGRVLRRLEADLPPGLALSGGARLALGGGAGARRAGAGAAGAWRRKAALALGRVAPVVACAVAVALPIPPLLAHVAVRVDELRLGYDLSAAAARLAALRADNERLRLERETLRAPDRLAPLAAEMGLHAPRPDALWRVAPDGAVTVANVVAAPAATARAPSKSPASAAPAAPAPGPAAPATASAMPASAAPAAPAPASPAPAASALPVAAPAPAAAAPAAVPAPAPSPSPATVTPDSAPLAPGGGT